MYMYSRTLDSDVCPTPVTYTVAPLNTYTFLNPTMVCSGDPSTMGRARRRRPHARLQSGRRLRGGRFQIFILTPATTFHRNKSSHAVPHSLRIAHDFHFVMAVFGEVREARRRAAARRIYFRLKD